MQPKRIPPLFSFASFPDFSTTLAELESLAQKEEWEYQYTNSEYPRPILYSYLHFTFNRLETENSRGTTKIAITSPSQYACFNTGLVTENQEEIFAFFEPNKRQDKQKWLFREFKKASDRDLMRYFPVRPDIAHYIDNPSELIFDTTKKVQINFDHITDAEHLERYPKKYREMSETLLRNILKGSIDEALIRVKRNYKTAIPQFYQNRIQLLLPLCFEDRSKADLALVVDKQGDDYRVHTCLPLDWAYNNARLLAKPDREWLLP